jgi:hypothetical protein
MLVEISNSIQNDWIDWEVIDLNALFYIQYQDYLKLSTMKVYQINSKRQVRWFVWKKADHQLNLEK